MDFTSDDASLFPIYIEKGGQLYGFCPGKATWDASIAGLYQALVITAETGIMLEDGPLVEQADWWIELLAWFLPYYGDQKFWSRAKAILGSENKKGK
jgi:hypothetical protein